MHKVQIIVSNFFDRFFFSFTDCRFQPFCCEKFKNKILYKTHFVIFLMEPHLILPPFLFSHFLSPFKNLSTLIKDRYYCVTVQAEVVMQLAPPETQLASSKFISVSVSAEFFRTIELLRALLRAHRKSYVLREKNCKKIIPTIHRSVHTLHQLLP